jgi:signal transduction histidine kinase
MLGKLRNRLLLINIGSIALVLVVSFVAIFVAAVFYMHGADERRVADIPSDIVSNAISAEGAAAAGPGGLDFNDGTSLPIDYSKTFVVNFDNMTGRGSVFTRISDLTQSDYVSAVETVRASGTSSGVLELGGDRWRYLVTGRGGENIVFLNVQDTENTLAQLLLTMVIVALVVLGVLFVTSLRLANRAIRPVQESMDKQRRFVADASHELKTPLAIIDASAEAMRINPGELLRAVPTGGSASLLADEIPASRNDVNLGILAEQQKWLGRIEEESERMRRLIEDLLYLAKAEDAEISLVPVDLGALIEGLVRRVEAVAFVKRDALEVAGSGSCDFAQDGKYLVRRDGGRLELVLLVVVDNAL